MILTRIECEICKNKEENTDETDEIDENLVKEFECNHFDVNMIIHINNKTIEQKLLIECKNCKNENIKVNVNKIEKYKCDACGFGSLSFIYKISSKSEKSFQTPSKEQIIQDDEKKMNLRFFYQGNNYNFVVNENDNLAQHYESIRQKINFSDGKKILYNNIPIDKLKSFKENRIYDGMKLEIEL